LFDHPGVRGDGASRSYEVHCPTNRTIYVVWNSTAGDVTFKTVAGTGIPVNAGAVMVLYLRFNGASWVNERYAIALLIKGRSGGASTKHLYRSGSYSTGDHILFLTSGTTPNLRHQASGGGTITITSSVAIVNDTTWSTIVGTWRPGRLELYVDGFSRTSSTAAATTTRALSGIYRWGWGFSTSQDFKGDIALIACFASSWTPAMVRRWHADPFGFLRCRRSWGVRRPPRPHQPARAWSPS
jgi:Concanavalin A-like lectin/glucanases superfamily